MEIAYKQVNGFSQNKKGGNPAGVVEVLKLSANEKQKIAQTLGFSETVFVSPSSLTDIKLEYFTPKEEVPLCGHATIASLGLLFSRGYFKEKKEIKIETLAGILNVVWSKGMVFMTQSPPEFLDTFSIEKISQILNLESSGLKSVPQVVSTGLRDCLVEVSDLATLRKLKPNLSAMRIFSLENNLIGFHVFSLETLESSSTAMTRNFAPSCGIDEESATGTSNLALASLLLENKKIHEREMIFEQGDFMNAPSRVFVKKIDKQLCVGGSFHLVQSGVVKI